MSTFYVLKHTEPSPGESYPRRRTILVSAATWEDTSNPQDNHPGTFNPDPFEAHTRTAREFVESFEVAGYRWPAEPAHLLGEPSAESPLDPRDDHAL